MQRSDGAGVDGTSSASRWGRVGACLLAALLWSACEPAPVDDADGGTDAAVGADSGTGDAGTGTDDGGTEGDAGTEEDAGTGDAGTGLPPEEPPTKTVTTLEEQLQELGVNVAAIQASPRRLDDQVSAPDSWSPLGMRARLAPKELLVAGVGHDCVDRDSSTPDNGGLRVMALELYDQTLPGFRPAIECTRYERGAFEPNFGPHPDGSRTQPGSQSSRTIVTGDFDNDGLDEGIVFNADFRPSANPAGWWISGYQLEHRGAEIHKAVGYRSMGTLPIVDMEAIAGDFNGDGRDDVMLGFIRGTALRLRPMLQTAAGEFDERFAIESHSIEELTGTVSLTMAAGNLDLDPQHEFVVLVRALSTTATTAGPSGEVRYFIFDDMAPNDQALTLLSSGTLTYSDPQTGTTRGFLVADVALGDFDGDGIDELAYTGLAGFAPDGSPCDPYTFVYRVLDDLAHGGGELTTKVIREGSPACSSTSDPGIIYEVMALSLDHDGDYTRELLANERIFKLVGRELVQQATVPGVIGQRSSNHVSEATIAIAAADVSNDGRAEVLVYSTHDSALRMTGKDFSRTISFNDQGNHPLLSPFDTDVDGSTVVYVPGSHRVVLTEPIIHAVLAAPPYDVALGQDPLNAVTSYGTGTSSGSSQETTISFSAGAMMGLSVGGGFGPIELSLETTVQLDTWVDKTQGTSYEVTHTDTYETAGRDAVVFTSFPYDVYDYRIVSSDIAANVGQLLSIMLPRTPSTRIVSRTYFNARVPDGGLKIDERVLRHTEGDLSSYMSSAEKLELKNRVSSGSYGSKLFLESIRKTVGEGDTNSTTGIDLSTERFHSEAVGFSRTHEVAFTGGAVMAGFSIGEGEENSVSSSAGQSTSVSGTVPSITVDDSGNPDAVYDYGMFTYMQRFGPTGDSAGQLFQVINYWVD